MLVDYRCSYDPVLEIPPKCEWSETLDIFDGRRVLLVPFTVDENKCMDEGGELLRVSKAAGKRSGAARDIDGKIGIPFARGRMDRAYAIELMRDSLAKAPPIIEKILQSGRNFSVEQSIYMSLSLAMASIRIFEQPRCPILEKVYYRPAA